ncbi:MCE family protein [Mycolicibacterium sp. lyk4-40-TYG-92]|uniref:MCE family protein n=1 Tax=Mycolicibacterium sp. lyk4-40-TYG-92 TaxID=3040295 RepID=UPI002550D51C|nr:MCE family protein [Mycolicibacterium sp. lyk4-40-TYG-92]
MKDNVLGASWRLAIFAVVCLFALFALLLVFAQLRFQPEKVYRAEFSNGSGLKEGNFVRIAGVEVGKVTKMSIQANSVVLVEFSADDSVVLTEGTRAVIRWADTVGNRYLALEDGAGDSKRLGPGATIPPSRTQPALELDALVGGFRPLFRALDPDQVNALSGQLVAALQGQGTTIGSFLAQTSVVTNTLANRDELIGEVITNLGTVLQSLGDQSQQVDKAVVAVSELVKGLAARKTDIANAVASTDEAATSVTDLLTRVRPPVQKVVHETDRSAGIVVADHEYFDNLLNTLPEAYQALSRQGLYGDYFSFYLCDAVLKLNGKGGQPVYVKVAGQTTGRCAPK